MNNLEKAVNIYQTELLRSERAMEYLNNRGITEDTAKKFRLGYAPGNGFLYENLADITEESGLVRSNGSDYFNDYIIFPIIVGGLIKSLTARRLTDDMPKHLHLIGGSKYIYNYDLIKDNGRIFLVESPFNALTLCQWGYAGVATLGATSFKKTYARVLQDKIIYIAYDNDSNGSGQKAALKTAEILYKESKKNSYILNMPLDVDINDYAKNNSQKDFSMNIITKAVEYTSTKEFRLNQNKRKFNNKRPFIPQKDDVDDIEMVKQIPMKALLDILGIALNTYGTLNKSICPLPGHEEKEESFVVYEKTNTYKCFGCGAFGDNISLVRSLYNLSFKDAIKLLTKLGGML